LRRGGTSNLSEFETAVAARLIVQQAGVCMHVMKARFALLQVQAPRLRTLPLIALDKET
jgi:hypothetical protein